MALPVDSDKFARLMEPVARKLLGDPNKAMSDAAELRFGTQGSVSINLESGAWFDHEAKAGGGVMDLVKRELKLEGREAIEWLNREVGGEFEDRKPAMNAVQRIVATYDYPDEHGELLFQVCRFEPKTFRQRRPDPSAQDGWSWSVRGVRQILYRLPEVRQAIANGEPVYIVEGEKDADALAREGLCGTCNAMGAGKWSEGLSGLLSGADVVIIPDNDDAGRAHAAIVGSGLRGVAKSVRVLELPGLPPKGDVSDWLANGGDGTELTILGCKAKPWAPDAPKSRFGAVQWADVDSSTVNYVPLVKGLIYQGDTGMIFGESGAGKSFLALDMALAIARGVPFLGMKTAKGAVLYQAGEGQKGFLRRIDAYKRQHMSAIDVPFVTLTEKVNLFSEDGDRDAFIAECLAWKAFLPDPLLLIVIDTFSAASVGANENASEDMGRMLDAGDRLNKATGAAVVWVHHKNAAGLRERGHSSFRANIETVLEVRKDEETKERSVRLAKMKDGPGDWSLGFELHPVSLGTDNDGDPITSCVVGPAQVQAAQTGKRGRLPKSQSDFLTVLDDAIRQWGGIVPGVDAYGADREVVRDLYKQVCGYGKETDAIRQAWQRATKDLLVNGMIGHKDQWLWITDKGAKCL